MSSLQDSPFFKAILGNNLTPAPAATPAASQPTVTTTTPGSVGTWVPPAQHNYGPTAPATSPIIPPAAPNVYNMRPGTPRRETNPLAPTGMPQAEYEQQRQEYGYQPIPLPLYDEGGDVDVNDGKHQLAILQDGERVLTPEENDQYKAEHPSAAREERKESEPLIAIDPEHDSNELIPTSKPQTKSQTSAGLKPEEVNAVTHDVQQGVGKGANGGLTQIGMGLIHARSLGKINDLSDGVIPPPPLIDDLINTRPRLPGLRPIVEPPPSSDLIKTSPAPTGKAAYDAKVREYDAQYQSLLDQAAKNNNPALREQAARVKEAKLEYQKAHPWGAPESEHPGLLGKIGHVAEMIASRTPGLAPIMATMPQSEVGMGLQREGTREQVKEASAENVAESKPSKTLEPVQQLINAGEELHAAQASGDQNAITAAKSKYDNIVSAIKTGKAEPKDATIDQQMVDAERQRDEAQAKGDLAGVAAANAEIKRLQEARPHTSEVEKLKYQGTVSKLSAAGLSSDPNKLKASLQAAVKNNIITAQDAADANGYIAANPSAATQVIVAGEKGDAEQARKNAGKYFTYSDEEGTHLVTGDKLPKDAEATPVKDPQVFMREAETGNVVQKSFNRLHQDIYQHPEIFDKATARNILATTLDQIDRSTAAILVAGTGGSIPLPSGMGEMINTALQNNTLTKGLADALKQYIADYKSAKDKVIILQMEAQGGKIGRGNANQFKAIADQLPNGATPDSKTAFRQMRNIQEMHSDLMRQFPDRRGPFKKEPAYVPEGTLTPSDYTYHYSSDKGEIVSNDGKTWFYVNSGKRVGE